MAGEMVHLGLLTLLRRCRARVRPRFRFHSVTALYREASAASDEILKMSAAS